MDFVRIHQLLVHCIVGVRPSERREKQPVRLSLTLGLDLSRAGQSGRIADTIDYSRVAEDVSSLLCFREYRLIEMATEEISAMLFGCYPELLQVRITLEKPEALRGRAQGASVQVRRSRAAFPPREEHHAWGRRQILLDTEEARLEVLHLAPGATRVSQPALPGRRVEWVLSGAVHRGGAVASLGEVHENSTQPLSYENRSPLPALIFACTSPGA
jgi:dihydroneopterin aldolase